MTNHTKLPWKRESRLISGDGTSIGCVWYPCREEDEDLYKETSDDRAEAEANAEFIVKACNNHYKLLEACKAFALVEPLRETEGAIDLAKEAIAAVEEQK